ncbi:hypothetical protein A8C32_11935 [Flavivirga aquatica]|uniref:DUF3157 domain-containing protein n=1 Tax=Flavivirga aquatica TaxID=1849968 RepID=A0A1E5TDI5_9FLAO|nr:DUF3157 family protein [Flavivirga aquatica]OEK09421.1 hypothetical protein A8C32_11935 [Flavivirga aquatica]
MKTLIFTLFLFIASVGFAQNNYIVKTEDGKRVLLKADFTWEYIDLEKPETGSNVAKQVKPLKSTTCNVAQNFTEPKLNKKIQSQLKRGRASINHIKKKVAKDYNCTVDAILLLSFSEQKEKGVYHFCANGTKVAYKRMGNSILKKGKFF